MAITEAELKKKGFIIVEGDDPNNTQENCMGRFYLQPINKPNKNLKGPGAEHKYNILTRITFL